MNSSGELARFVNSQELEINSDNFFRCDADISFPQSDTQTEIIGNTPNQITNEINKLFEEMKLISKQFNDNLLKLVHLYNLFIDSVDSVDMQ